MNEANPPDFNEWGYLAPPGPHKGSLCHIRFTFVENMVSSETRPKLFNNMVGIIGTFINLLSTDCFQVWIGGIFISNIQEPDDTDCCLLISPETFNNADEATQNLILKFMHPETDPTKSAEAVHRKMGCGLHILLNETDCTSPSYLVNKKAKEMMDTYYQWDSDRHPCGYFICNTEEDKENDTENNA